jgi:hypothetical protein
MRAGAALLIMLAAAPPPALAQTAPPLEPGVSLALARWRAGLIREPRYALELRIDERRRRASGRLSLAVELARRADLVLDWRGSPVRDLRVNGRPTQARHARGHLVIPRAALRKGANRVELAFRAPIAVQEVELRSHGTPVEQRGEGHAAGAAVHGRRLAERRWIGVDDSVRQPVLRLDMNAPRRSRGDAEQRGNPQNSRMDSHGDSPVGEHVALPRLDGKGQFMPSG